jgi:hypothetical protein
MLYFVMLGGIGKTPGAFMSRLPAAEETARLHLPAIPGRALLH